MSDRLFLAHLYKKELMEGEAVKLRILSPYTPFYAAIILFALVLVLVIQAEC